jgi:shikimate kinase
MSPTPAPNFAPSSPSAQRVFLIGLSGVGKTTFGQTMAETLGWPFLDLDAAIAQAAGTAVTELFRTHGEAAFRELEAATLRRVGLATPLVLATGGGTPCFHQSMDWLLAHGRVVWLDLPPATIAQRLLHAAPEALVSRPLLAAASTGSPQATETTLADFLTQTLAARAPFYHRAPDRLTSPDLDSASWQAMLNL